MICFLTELPEPEPEMEVEQEMDVNYVVEDDIDTEQPLIAVPISETASGPSATKGMSAT